jgi:hypothetical protein
MSKLVTISLTDECYLLWMKLEEKSVWVRQKLYEEIFDGDLEKHIYSERARAEGQWEGRCTPNGVNGICRNCWAPDALSVLSVNPETKMYISPTPTTPKQAIKKFLEQRTLSG